MLERLSSLLRGSAATRNVHPVAPAVKPEFARTDGPPAAPTVRRVLSVIYNPVVDRRSGAKLSRAMGWYDPDELAAEYADDVREATHGLLDYQVVDRTERDTFYPLIDGFTYDT